MRCVLVSRSCRPAFGQISELSDSLLRLRYAWRALPGKTTKVYASDTIVDQLIR